MRIEFIEDEQDEICGCCEEMISQVEDFMNEYIEIKEEGTFSFEYFSEMLFDLYKQAKLEGSREAFEQIGNISMNLAFPSDECNCCNEEDLD